MHIEKIVLFRIIFEIIQTQFANNPLKGMAI